ncbi:hypothetical protein DMP23_09565 [Amycolatopsis sp. A1MSW2902]|uniref:non-ribosomal peptide synthetase n=1 Tax=Amycolatopsis sp. A1MSW2902 TaxID=687413 RepID=UPI00307D0BE4
MASTTHRITAEDVAGRTGSVIGTALANQRVLVLDELGRRVPPGVPGEIHVCGPAVADGYHARPDLTAERFTDDPEIPGERRYRTGDLAVSTSDGELVYLGRADQQVKIRGFRLELAEVEAALRGHPAVRAAVATTTPGPVPILHAYAVPEHDPAPAADLTAHLARQIPDHAVPAKIGWLDPIPMTDNGKVDRAALPPFDGPDAAEAPHRPWTEREIAACAVVARLLGVPAAQVNPGTDLTVVGLQSLYAMRLVAAFEEELGLWPVPGSRSGRTRSPRSAVSGSRTPWPRMASSWTARKS